MKEVVLFISLCISNLEGTLFFPNLQHKQENKQMKQIVKEIKKTK